MDKISYRILDAGDLNIYKEIRLECLKYHPDNFGTLFEEEINSNRLKYDDALLRNDGKDFLYGAFSNEKIIGLCGFESGKRLKSAHRGDLNHLYVKPEFTKTGIGKKLICLVLEKAFENKFIEQIELGVVEKNNFAVELYKRIGFTETGTHKNYFKLNDKYMNMVFMILTRDNYLNYKSNL